MLQPDEQYVRSCLDGQPADFRHLVERYQSPLLRCLRARLGDAEKAAEVAQETFVRAYFTLSKLKKTASFFSWLLGIADRVAKEMHRADGRHQSADGKQLDLEKMPGKQDTREEASVAEAVARLPAPYREVVLLRFHGGQSCAEIGHNLNIPLGTVTKRLSRAYALLREQLGSEFARRESEAPR